MKIESFRVQNCKSVIDTKWCHMAPNGLMMIVGQNESGKTTTLEALNYFGNGKQKNHDHLARIEHGDAKPITVEVKFSLDVEDISSLSSAYSLPVKFFEDLKKTELHVLRSDGSDNNELVLDEEANQQLWDKFFSSYKNGKVYEKADTGEESAKQGETESKEDQGERALTAEEIEYKAEEMYSDFLEDLLLMIPKFSLYDSFTDILPDEIVLADIAKYNAVKDFMAVYSVDFSKIANSATSKRESNLASINEFHTQHISERWRQKLFDGHNYRFKSVVVPQISDMPNTQISFLIDNSDNNWLPSKQRSAGFRWFSALDLRLQAIQAGKNTVLLIDEPSQFLHESAQKDLRDILKDLAIKGFQILVTTHSPHLLDIDAPQEIRIVSQEKNRGTLIETINQYISRGFHSGNTSDPLSPIRTSMGLISVDPLLHRQEKHALVEGMSDKYYLDAFAVLLQKTKPILFPCGGAPKVPPMFSIFTGWGIPVKAILDNDGSGKAAKREITNSFLLEDQSAADAQILMLKNTTIETLFNAEDFAKHVMGDTAGGGEKTIGELVSMLSTTKDVAALTFCQSCVDGTLKLNNFTEETRGNFTEVLAWLNA